jgi:hypothetical protein
MKARAIFDQALRRGPGGNNNPNRDPETGRLVSKSERLNVYVVNVEAERPNGNTIDAGLRRLTKAAEAGDSRARIMC